MLLLRWLFDNYVPWSYYYDLEDSPREEFDDDYYQYYTEDDLQSVLYPDEDVREEYDEDPFGAIYFEDDISTELTYYPDEDTKEEFEDDWYNSYGLTDEADLVSVIVDHEEQIDEDIDWILGRLDDEVYDTDHITVIVDHDERIDDDDDWYSAYGVVDLPDFTEQVYNVYPDLDESREEYEDDYTFAYGQTDVVIVSDNEQWLQYIESDDPREEWDEDQTNSYGVVDLPDFTEQVFVVVDHDEDLPHEDDEWLFRLVDSPAVSDNEQWFNFFQDDDPKEESDDDGVLSYSIFDAPSFTDQIFWIISEDDLREEYDDDLWDAYATHLDKPDVSEQIWIVVSYDDDQVASLEDDLYDPYAQVDAPAPFVPPPGTIFGTRSQGPGSQTFIVRDRWGTGWTASRYRRGYSNG